MKAVGPNHSTSAWLLIQVKGDVLPFCHLSEARGAFTLPTAQDIRAKRAIVVTCGAAGLLREAYTPTPLDHPITFTHILIDEAGQVRSCTPLQYSHTLSIKRLSKAHTLYAHALLLILTCSGMQYQHLLLSDHPRERCNTCRRCCRKLWYL